MAKPPSHLCSKLSPSWWTERRGFSSSARTTLAAQQGRQYHRRECCLGRRVWARSSTTSAVLPLLIMTASEASRTGLSTSMPRPLGSRTKPRHSHTGAERKLRQRDGSLKKWNEQSRKQTRRLPRSTANYRTSRRAQPAGIGYKTSFTL